MEKFDEKQMKKVRVNYDRINKNSTYNEVEEIRVAMLSSISQMEKLAKKLNYSVGKVLNVGTIFNNKIAELSREFKNSGILLQVSDEEKYDHTEPSFIGRLIEGALLENFLEAEEIFGLHNFYLCKISTEKLQKYEEFKNLNMVKKLILKLKNPGVNETFDFSVTDEERKNLDFLLKRYKDIVNKIYNYKIDDNLIPLIINRLLDYEELGILRSDFDGTNISSYGFLKLQIIPELIKLGYTTLAKDLEKTWLDLKEKDKKQTEEENNFEPVKHSKHKK